MVIVGYSRARDSDGEIIDSFENSCKYYLFKIDLYLRFQ